jgi:hypothetical protein
MRNAQPAGSPGYTFPLMLIIVAAMAFAAMRLDVAQSYRLKRDKEADLLFRGLAYKRAIKAFHSKNSRYPRQLKELADDRDSSKPRFMRQLYKDPVTGGEFKLILGSEGAIMGVVSASRDVPFKKVDFDKELEDFGNAKTYANWKFETKPGSATSPPGIAPGASSSDQPARVGR